MSSFIIFRCEQVREVKKLVLLVVLVRYEWSGELFVS